MPGDKLKITAGVGAFSAAAKPENLYQWCNVRPLTADGTADFKTTVEGAGEKTVDVKIEYTKPDGTLQTVNKTS